MATIFGILSGALWIVSSAAWLWSAWTPSPVRPHPRGASKSIEMYVTDAEDNDWLSVNGLSPPNADEFFAYQRKVFFRNAVAAGTSALAALAACLSIILSQ